MPKQIGSAGMRDCGRHRDFLSSDSPSALPARRQRAPRPRGASQGCCDRKSSWMEQSLHSCHQTNRPNIDASWSAPLFNLKVPHAVDPKPLVPASNSALSWEAFSYSSARLCAFLQSCFFRCDPAVSVGRDRNVKRRLDRACYHPATRYTSRRPCCFALTHSDAKVSKSSIA
jgi:hypothetical protein